MINHTKLTKEQLINSLQTMRENLFDQETMLLSEYYNTDQGIVAYNRIRKINQIRLERDILSQTISFIQEAGNVNHT